MKICTVLLTVSIFLLVSCGGKESQDLKQTMDAMKAVSKSGEVAENMQEQTAIAEKRLAERRAKGDTISMHFEKLQEYLPAEISGYKAEVPYGQSFNAMGLSYSEASRKFLRKNADGSEDYIEVKLVDYNESYQIYAGLTAWVTSGFSIENTDGYEKGFKTNSDYAFGWEKYSKNDKRATVMVAIGYRFLLTVEADNQSGTEDLKNIVNRMNVKDLAKM